MRAALLGLLAAGAAWWLFRRQPNTTTAGEPEAEQEASAQALVWNVWQTFSEPIYETMAPIQPDTAATNTAAFLSMIRTAEGTADSLGYSALFGHRASKPRTFAGWVDHPRIAQQFTTSDGRRLWTSAAGAYQFMAVSKTPTGSTKVNTWDRIAARLGLPDFSPASQDAAAVELIREAGALGDVRAGRFDAAVSKVRGIWASLPGAGYSQPERSLESLRLAYLNNGGTLA